VSHTGAQRRDAVLFDQPVQHLDDQPRPRPIRRVDRDHVLAAQVGCGYIILLAGLLGG